MNVSQSGTLDFCDGWGCWGGFCLDRFMPGNSCASGENTSISSVDTAPFILLYPGSSYFAFSPDPVVHSFTLFQLTALLFIFKAANEDGTWEKGYVW